MAWQPFLIDVDVSCTEPLAYRRGGLGLETCGNLAVIHVSHTANLCAFHANRQGYREMLAHLRRELEDE